MTLMLTGVTGREEAELALAGGADILEFRMPASIAADRSVSLLRELLARVGRRCPVMARIPETCADPAQAEAAVRALCAAAVAYIAVPLPAGEDRAAFVELLAAPRGDGRMIAVLHADQQPDYARIIPQLAKAGWSGVMLDTSYPGARLLKHADMTAISAFLRSARDAGLMCGLAGALEGPDVPRLLRLAPDFLGFRDALLGGSRAGAALDPEKLRAIRRLIPRTPSEAQAGERAAENVKLAPDAGRIIAQRIFVRDFVLPARIGAYRHEKQAPQNVRFDVCVEVEPASVEPQGMAQVFSYDLITDFISALVAEGHFDLVETLAERIGAEMLRHPRALRATVRVEKLELGPGGVGVEVVMERLAGLAP